MDSKKSTFQFGFLFACLFTCLVFAGCHHEYDFNDDFTPTISTHILCNGDSLTLNEDSVWVATIGDTLTFSTEYGVTSSEKNAKISVSLEYYWNGKMIGQKEMKDNTNPFMFDFVLNNQPLGEHMIKITGSYTIDLGYFSYNRDFPDLSVPIVIEQDDNPVNNEDSIDKIHNYEEISFSLSMTTDLLEFVRPIVTLMDGETTLRTLSYSNLFSLSTDTLYNRVLVEYDDPNEWDIIDDSTSIHHFRWYIKERFENKKEIDYTIKVDYVPTGYTEVRPDSTYDFKHLLRPSFVIGTIGGGLIMMPFGYYDIEVNIGGAASSSSVKGDDVAKYIENLVNTPDVAGVYVSSEGKVKVRE